MTTLALPDSGLPAARSASDPVASCLDAALTASHSLFTATLPPRDAAALRAAIDGAAGALAAVATLADAVAEALAPATEDEILEEGVRLLRAWPQDRRGDMAGFGAELGLLLQERNPGRRALQQACRTLKLTKVFPPSIAEVMDAITAAEQALDQRVRAAAGLPARLARAEAVLTQPTRRPNPVSVASVTGPTPDAPAAATGIASVRTSPRRAAAAAARPARRLFPSLTAWKALGFFSYNNASSEDDWPVTGQDFTPFPNVLDALHPALPHKEKGPPTSR